MSEVSEMNDVASDGQKHADSASSVGSEMSLLDLLILMVRRRRFIFSVASITSVVALIVAFLLPLSYTATVILMPPQQNSSFSSTLLSQLGGLGSLAGGSGLGGALKSPTDLYVGLLKTEPVEDGMIQRFGLEKEYKTRRMSDARKALEAHVLVDGGQKDGMIRIEVQSKTPARAAELANGYVDEYRHLSQSLAIGEAAQRRLFLEQQLQKTKDNLATAEEDLAKSEQKTGMIQLDSQARALIESADQIRAQVAAKEVQIQAMKSYAGPGNVDLMAAQQELAGLQAQLAKLGGAGSIGDGDLLQSKGTLPQVGLEYVRKLREVKYNETIFDILARQYEAAKLDEAKEGALVQVVSPALPPDRKSGPPRMLITVAGVMLGLFGAIGWLSFQEALSAFRRNSKYATKLAQLGIH